MNLPPHGIPLPVILVTGFLGAGKTTLLLRWLSEAPLTGLRMGIVMNEFGTESVDGQLVRRPGLSITQVDGGCLCCAPDDSLERACRAMARDGQCDYLVVETSGLADPDNVIDVLTDHDLLDVVRLKSVVTVVDAPWFLRPEGGVGERVLARRQVEYADVVALSRCDLMDPPEVGEAEASIQEWNSRSSVVRMPFGLPDLPGILAGPCAHAAVEGAHAPNSNAAPPAHLHARYRSVSWRFPVPIHRDAFAAWLARLGRDGIVRAKGFVRFTDSPESVHVFQKTTGQHFVGKFPALPAPEEFGVLIGPDIDAEGQRMKLRAMWSSLKPGAAMPLGPAT